MPNARAQALLEELRQAGAGHAQTDNSGQKEGATDYAAEFGHEAWQLLAQRADSLRKLVRIKVADDNDLKTARSGLTLCHDFFRGLAQLAELRGGMDEHDLYRELELTA